MRVTEGRTLSSLSELNQEGLQLFERKKAELRQYGSVIDDAEQTLTSLKQTLQKQQAQLAELSAAREDDIDHASADQELDELENEHARTIRELEAKHREEFSTLKAELDETLEAARAWGAHHSAIVLERKQTELEAAKKLEVETKQRLTELSLASRRPGTRTNDRQSIEAQARIANLEQRISEITAITREEMREARAQIEESVVAVETRRQQNAAETARLEAERDSRDEKYDAVLSALQEQYDATKASLEQAIEATHQRTINTQRMIEQLSEHHQSQLTVVMDDMLMVKKTSIESKMQDAPLREILRQTEALREEKRAIVDELALVRREITDLDDENAILKRELAKLNSAFRSLKNEDSRS
jgi:hypothetical protein